MWLLKKDIEAFLFRNVNWSFINRSLIDEYIAYIHYSVSYLNVYIQYFIYLCYLYTLLPRYLLYSGKAITSIPNPFVLNINMYCIQTLSAIYVLYLISESGNIIMIIVIIRSIIPIPFFFHCVILCSWNLIQYEWKFNVSLRLRKDSRYEWIFQSIIVNLSLCKRGGGEGIHGSALNFENVRSNFEVEKIHSLMKLRNY